MSNVAEKEIDSEDFLPECEEMDLRPIMGFQFVVAISTGDRSDGKLLAKTLHGPYTFAEMVGEVGEMWHAEQNNAKVYILEKDRKIKPRWLDLNCIDYVQAKYATILMDCMLENFDEKQYTCVARTLGEKEEDAKKAKSDDSAPTP